MPIATRCHTILAVPFILAIAACGGGGDEAPPVTSAATYPLSVIVDNVVKETVSGQFRITGTASSNGQSVAVTGSGTHSTSSSASTFENANATKKTSTVTGTVTVAGTSIPYGGTSASYFGANSSPLGSQADGEYCVVTNRSDVPATAKVGDTNTWFNGTCYTSSSKSTSTGSVTVSYVLEADSDSTAILKLVNRRTLQNGQTNTAVSSARVTTTGAYSRIGETASMTINGILMNLQLTFL
jgi:hypothetical protein